MAHQSVKHQNKRKTNVVLIIKQVYQHLLNVQIAVLQ